MVSGLCLRKRPWILAPRVDLRKIATLSFEADEFPVEDYCRLRQTALLARRRSIDRQAAQWSLIGPGPRIGLLADIEVFRSERLRTGLGIPVEVLNVGMGRRTVEVISSTPSQIKG